MIRFASLGSGSGGNALIVTCGRTSVLLDCGFGPRETMGRLARLGVVPERLAGIVITHEHSDHIAGAFRFAQRFSLRLWMTAGTFAAAPRGLSEPPEVELIDSHRPFALDELELHPFPVPHDAREPVQFVFSDGNRRLGVLTDAGGATPHIERMLSGCEALVLECNHDAQMLRSGSYPAALKARIGGRFGHLDNSATAALLGAIDTSRLRHLVAAHLSEENNRPELARAALAGALNCHPEWVGIACQAQGFGWRDIC